MHRLAGLNINIKLAIFSLSCLALFVHLGLWQMDRELETRNLLQLHDQRLNQEPLPLAALLAAGDDVNGLPVRMQGHYLDRPALLKDNVVLKGKVGYEVLQVFEEQQTGRYFLVNRGFVPMKGGRTVRPVIPLAAEGLQALSAHVYVAASDESGFAQGELVDELGIVQTATPSMLAGIVGLTLYPHLLRLDEKDSAALPRYWQVTTMTPEKHRGYALQWFLMALAVVLAFGYFTYKTQDPDNDSGND